MTLPCVSTECSKLDPGLQVPNSTIMNRTALFGGSTASVAISDARTGSAWAVHRRGGTEGKCQTNVKYTSWNGKLPPKRTARSGEKHPSLPPSCFSNHLPSSSSLNRSVLPCNTPPSLPLLSTPPNRRLSERSASPRLGPDLMSVVVSGSAGVSSSILTSLFCRTYRGLLTALAVRYPPTVCWADAFFQRCSGRSQLACLARPWIC